jgi:D-alanyl-D-alanine carboxypeptidase
MVANGRVPKADLVQVGGDKAHPIYLEKRTAHQFMRMAAAFTAATGLQMTVWSPAGGYRSLWMQADMRLRPWRYNLSVESTVPVAFPGSSSHGFGTRVDVQVGVGWVLQHGPEFGFFLEFPGRDPNHFMWDGSTVSGEVVAPIVDTRRRKKMMWMKSKTSGSCYLVGEFSWSKVVELVEQQRISAQLGFDAEVCSSDTIKNALDRVDGLRAALIADVVAGMKA